jgi:hypothetical protein
VVTSLDKIKDEMIDKVVSQLSNMKYMTSTEKSVYKSNLISKVKSKLLATTLRLQNGLTNADDYNQTAYELYLDILTTFNYVNELYATINTHQMLNESIINTLYSSIAALNDKLDEYEAVIGTAGSPACFIEGFRTQNFKETDYSYYTERYGEIMPMATYVRFNSEQENVTLNYTRQQNVMVYKSGVQLGEISITKQYGAGFIKARNSEAKLENAIDTSKSSYWAETILADAEMKVVGEGYANADGLGQLNRSFYDLPRGAMCEICLTFESLTKINEIVLNPFGNFPIDVIAIRYTLTDDDDEDVYDVVYPDNADDWLSSKSIKQEYAFHFPEITCKKLYILINQLHCIKDTYMVSCNQMFKNELWFNATYDGTEDAVMENTTVFAPLYLDRAMEDNVWRYINNKIVTNKNIDINDLLINNNNKMLPVTKYQYTYGFYNIAPNFVEFQKAGIWVSQEIEVDGPIDTIRLESEEEHYKTSDGHIATDVEFYITTKQNPSYQDWKPICPTNKDYIYHELLQLDYDYCYLRHKAVCGNTLSYDKDGNQKLEMVRPIVYMNDIVLTEDADYILRYDDDNNVYAIEVSNIDHFALYTVSYQPTESSKELSLIDEDNPIPSNSYEEIMGNGTACYELQSYPFYSRSNPELTSSYVKIINVQTNEVLNQTNQENSPIQCVTNKDNPADSYKNFIANTNKIQYYTNGRFIYFNQPISNMCKIEINYPSFDSKIRVKAILRRNTKRDSWITPVLKKYKLEFTTI